MVEILLDKSLLDESLLDDDGINLRKHTIREGVFLNPSAIWNRVVVIGRDVDDSPVFGHDENTTDIGLNGERLKPPVYEPAAITTAIADAIAASILDKSRFELNKGYMITPPNVGIELFDVITVTDKYGDQSSAKYRVLGIATHYSSGKFYQILKLGEV